MGFPAPATAARRDGSPPANRTRSRRTAPCRCAPRDRARPWFLRAGSPDRGDGDRRCPRTRAPCGAGSGPGSRSGTCGSPNLRTGRATSASRPWSRRAAPSRASCGSDRRRGSCATVPVRWGGAGRRSCRSAHRPWHRTGYPPGDRAYSGPISCTAGRAPRQRQRDVNATAAPRVAYETPLGGFPLSATPRLLAAAIACCAVRALPAQSGHHGLDPANLDTTCAPCQDFNRYANGGWLARTTLPPEYASYGSFVELVERNNETLHRIVDLLAALAPAVPPTTQHQLRAVYASCIDSGPRSQAR